MGHNSGNGSSSELSFTRCSCTIPQFWFQLELMIRYGSLVSLVSYKSQQLTKGMTSFLFHS